jgi:eukaryotic-like serine/threonine-protein kinase
MNPNREEGIFAAALELPAEKRADYIRDACGGDDELRKRVEALLAAHEKAGGFLAEPAALNPKGTIVLSFPVTEKAGDKIGRYKLLQQIGEGGCGVVYMAEQEEPVRRRVALKVIKLGMDTKSVIARFEAERQALAMMDHPNIAKVLDAGATDNGRPFFVMELVRGIKITDYCDQNKLSTDDRLELFTQVCNAIQHAHQKGIIHRDIKPSNILVTLHDGKPVPKVIDFGIAKATQGRLTDQTLFTAFEQFIGTPAYMSPEQAEMSGLDVDTRSDIYALGVLLYELLTGRTPFDAKELLQAGLDELRRMIREKEPARPSTRLSTMLDADLTTVAQRRQSEAPKLIHLLRGDLDWIVMKSLEKDRTRRYETANGMAMDIQRYLHNEPVTARPPSTLYKFQKLVRRNRTIFAAAGAGVAALVLGLILSLYLFVEERSALKRAVVAEQKEKQLREQAERSSEMGRQLTKAGLLLMGGKYDESERIVDSVAPHSTMVPFYNTFGSIHARHAEWQAALTNWSRVVQYAPDDHIGYMNLAPLLLQLDEVNGYKQCRTEIIQHFGNTTDPRIAERMAKTSLILPPTAEDLVSIAKMAEVAGKGEVNDSNWGYNLVAMGLAEYRLGHYDRASELLTKALPLDIGSTSRTEAWVTLAMTEYQLGQSNQCRYFFTNAVNSINHTLPRAGHLDDQWYDWINIHVLLKEALATIPEAGTWSPDLPGQKPAWQVALAKSGFKFQLVQQDDGTWEVDGDDQPVEDISMLQGAPLSRLTLMHTSITNLAPLRGMALKWLRIQGTKVSDLSPLQGMPLESLQISGTPVTDLSPVRGMPLKLMMMTNCKGITSLGPLRGITTIETIVLPPNAKDFGFFRNEPQLQRISFKYDKTHGPAQTAAEFWAEQDGKTGTAQP